ncbi:GAF and ANTAR domain-containing protein [Nocardioides sp. R-C-SC26]|uniref:GAF and ANTAR domain-containing protein n=1 Tax=Nocardioides sp. R-C-SC26 TaxID=2870414 RepID=UPI001E3C38B6|nr:GAF and ANTAR domain-containing protein [Nocardioides sp. R-C-SC26]
MSNDNRTDLARYFAQISDDLHRARDGMATSELVTTRAVEVVEAADHCGLTVRGKRSLHHSEAASSPTARRADELQSELNDGPCIDAAFEQEDFVISDLQTESRWSSWTRGALDLGIRSAYAVAIRGESGPLGAINFYAESPGAFDDPTERALASVYASHAGEALRRSQVVTGLRAALDSRHAIGIAQGVLATTYGVDYETAFSILHRYSNDANIKLRDVAQTVLDTGSLPPLEVSATADSDTA